MIGDENVDRLFKDAQKLRLYVVRREATLAEDFGDRRGRDLLEWRAGQVRAKLDEDDVPWRGTAKSKDVPRRFCDLERVGGLHQ